MIFPLLILIVASLGVLGYFARRNITWTNKQGTSGSLGMAVVVFIVFALIGWALDAWLDWSIIPTYMAAVGGSLQFLAYLFYALFALLCLSMLTSAAKCGSLVA